MAVSTLAIAGEGSRGASEGISEQEIASLLSEYERASTSYRGSQLADEQAAALDYYYAEPLGDEEDGRSQIVLPDVAEVVDYMTVSVLRTCVAGDRVVEFEASDVELDDKAQEATEAVDYVFMRRQDGYRVLLDWIKSGLIEKIGVVKTCVRRETVKRRQSVRIPVEGIALLQEDGAKIVSADEGDDGLWTVIVEQEIERAKFEDIPIPSGEFLFAQRTRHEDDSEYVAHRTRKTLSDLVEMGFDREIVAGLSSDDNLVDDDWREVNRYEDERNLDMVRKSPEMREVFLCEEYVRLDRDGDGIAELLQVFRVDKTILGIEEVEQNPFVVFCPFPMPHRLVGQGLADKVMDIQRIRSVLMRQTLDGIYLTNNPRQFLPEEGISENTIEDLLTVRPGGIVRGRANFKPEPLYEPFDPQKGMGLLEFFAGERESRTGITRLNQGLDADAVNKTATGTALMQAQGQQIEEFIARNFAEAMSRLFRKKLRLMVDHGEPFAIKVEGRAVQVDPRLWPEEMDVSIRVGLGSGRKEQRLAYRMQLLEIQREGAALGLVGPKQLYNSARGVVNDMAVGEVTDYFVDPDSEEAKAAAANRPPDPEQQKVEAEAAANQAKLQLEARKAEASILLEREKNEARIEIEREKAAVEAQLARDKAVTEAEMAREKMDFEMQMAREQMVINAEIARESAKLNAEVKKEQNKLPKNRPGGELHK